MMNIFHGALILCVLLDRIKTRPRLFLLECLTLLRQSLSIDVGMYRKEDEDRAVDREAT